MNRRNFIGKTTLLTCLNVLGLSALKASSFKSGKSLLEPLLQEDMIYRTLGRTGLKLPVVNMGVMNANIPGLVRRSYEKGVRLFDTAWFYQNGMNEKMVGDTLAGMGVRDQSVIVTKIFLKEVERDHSTPDIKDLFLQRFEESLRRLKTDYVDILLYHAVSTIEEQNNPYIIEAMSELKKAGKCRFCGVSFHGDDPLLLDDVVAKGFYDVALIIFNIAYADDKRLKESMERAAKEGIGIIAMKTQCGGGGHMWWDAHQDSRATLGELNQTAMLKWVLQHDFITTAIPGYTTYDQLEENISVAYNLEYTEQEKAFLGRASVQLASSFCIQCSECRESCPARVDIPTLMRTYMYAYMYNNMEHAMATEKTLSAKSGINRCYECDSCTAQCKRSINLSNRIMALKDLNFRRV